MALVFKAILGLVGSSAVLGLLIVFGMTDNLVLAADLVPLRVPIDTSCIESTLVFQIRRFLLAFALRNWSVGCKSPAEKERIRPGSGCSGSL